MVKDPELYLLQAQCDGAAWQVIVQHVYLDLVAAKADARSYARCYGVVRVINRSTRHVEYTARALIGQSRLVSLLAPSATEPDAVPVDIGTHRGSSRGDIRPIISRSDRRSAPSSRVVDDRQHRLGDGARRKRRT